MRIFLTSFFLLTNCIKISIMKYFREFALFSIAALLLGACNDSTSFGLDLLSEDTTKVGFSDTLLVQSTTVTGDLVEVYSPFTAASAYLCGQLNDPIFGIL